MQSAVKNLRQHLLMTQLNFANELGCSREMIGKYESGKVYPRSSTIKKMMELARKNKIKIKVEDFLKDEQ